MRKGFKVILDVDDVLYQCNQSAINLLNKEENTNYTINDVKNWGMINDPIDKRVKYFDDPVFIKNLPMFEGAQEFVRKLSKKAEIFVCTNVQPQCVSARYEALLRDFPEIDPNNILIGGRKDLLFADMMLDDAIHNLENARVDYPVLFQRPWNSGNAGILSVTGYKEFLELVDIIKTSKSTDYSENYNMLVLVGPSGSGKKCIAQSFPDNPLFERVKTYSTKKDENYKSISKEEFLKKKEENFFIETSSYLGEFFGIHKKDIDHIISKGKYPLLILDINGVVSMKHFYNSLNIFVKSPKENCIKNIITKTDDIDKKVKAIVSLDAEYGYEELCDYTIKLENDKFQVDNIIERYFNRKED